MTSRPCVPRSLQVLLAVAVSLPAPAEETQPPAGRRDVVGAPNFERDVQPLLTRYGCNAGACHGKARGQNGFQLSIFGFDPDFDFDAIARAAAAAAFHRPPLRTVYCY